jgi:transcription antitermination protein NusB
MTTKATKPKPPSNPPKRAVEAQRAKPKQKSKKPAPSEKRSPSKQRRTFARLAVVQGLYQMEVAGSGMPIIQAAFVDGHLPEVEAVTPDADKDLFNGILVGVVEQQGYVDTHIAKRLAKGWKLERLDAVARAILRAGACELLKYRDKPPAPIISDYVEIAKSFFEGGVEPGFVNAALDSIAKSLKTGDLD